MPVSFDFVNLIIDLPSATPTIDAQVDLYSDWKEAVKVDADAPGAPQAFRTVAGDPTIAGEESISPYYFLQNQHGWRIRPADEDAEVTITGNLFKEDDTIDSVVSRPGRTIVVRGFISPQSLTRGSGLDATQDTRLTLVEQILRNKLVTNPGTGKLELWNDAGTAVLFSIDLFEDAAGTQPYQGQGAERRERIE